MSRSKKPEPFEKHVLPHGELEEIISGRVWRVTGSLSYLPVQREMDVYRFEDGESLMLYSVVALNERGMKSVEELGKPVLLVVPNKDHRLDIGVYADRYPEAKVVCPRVCRDALEEVVKVDGIMEEECLSRGEYVSPFEVIPILGVDNMLTVISADVGNGSVVLFLGDLLFNIVKRPANSGIIDKLLSGWVFKWYGPLHLPRFGRMLLLEDRREFARWLLAVASEKQIAALVVCHGDPITEGCSDRLTQLATAMDE